MNDNYNEIIKQLHSKRNNYFFGEKELNSLSEEQRKDVEKSIVSLCQFGIEEAYKYIPLLNSIDVLKQLDDSHIKRVKDHSKNLIYIYLYIRTKDVNFLHKINKKTLKINHFGVLLKEFKNNFNAELLSFIMNYVGNDEQLIKYSYLCIYGQPNISTIDPYKVRSGIIGFAIGDALGVPVEFTDRQSRKIAPVTDMQGYGSHHVPEGTWSDDTSMSIAFMDSVIKEEKIDYDDIMQRFCDWCIKAEYTATDKVFDIGITTRQALSAYYYKRNDALHCGLLDYNSNGNGSLMRMLPVAIYLYANKFSETEEVEIVNNLSGLTHAHEISKLGCKIYCDYMKRILSGIDKKQAYEQLKSIEYDKYYSTETIDKYSRLLRGDISKLTESEISSSGYIVSTLEASIWCTLNSQKYDEAVLKAVNLGSDTDTVGAITGGINGCIYGENNFPDNWKSKLKKYNYLVNMSNGFINILNNQKNKHLSM